MAGMSTPETKAEKGATLVMETNSSSIVSKRSVERMYHPEPHFFRYFVKKPQRRSPLINRGYWLRMYAIEHAVCEFLKEPSERPKLVINFGCGFDPLPFQLMSREPSLCANARFIDIDYEKLMFTKRDVIQRNKILNDLVPDDNSTVDNDSVVIRSKRYLGIGCDLKNIRKLEETLKGEMDLSHYSILCTAEVSLTYMDVKSADALIHWVSKLSNDVQFRLLEQYFPDGPKHPFAATMMKHFAKLQAPLYSIHEYPSLQQQQKRFVDAGWGNAEAKSLWSLWNDPEFLSFAQRRKLDEVEPFDEWEEFALFASHYFLISASTREEDGHTNASERPKSVPEPQPPSLKLSHSTPPSLNIERRLSVTVPIGLGAFGVHGGFGREARLASTDIYSLLESEEVDNVSAPPLHIGARMCHSSTQLSGYDCLLAGGRSSPRVATSDCWLRKSGLWQPAGSLPSARFRHCATCVQIGDDGTESVLIYGGKTGTGDILDQWLLWDYSHGWQEVKVAGKGPTPRFGASMTCLDHLSGILFGGMTEDGVNLDDFWTWTITRNNNGDVSIRLTEHTGTLRASNILYKWLGRFGASTSLTAWGLVVVGGISLPGCIPHTYEMMLLDSEAILGCIKDGSSLDRPILSAIRPDLDSKIPRPLLTGHVSWTAGPESVLIVGGGGVCFSFGTFRNQGTWLLQNSTSKQGNKWRFLEEPTPDKTLGSKVNSGIADKPVNSGEYITRIPRVTLNSSQDFMRILGASKPVILTGLDIGLCRELWTKEYLGQAVGRDRKIVVHEARTEQMNFQTKNFSYVTKGFGEFLDEVHAGGRQYLRSISSDKPSETPANLAQDFPGLRDDFRLPPQLATASEQAHSSPLRISGAVTMWLHYDVLANVLCQVRGSKTLILYPPPDVTHLHFPPGASSSTLNIFPDSSSTPIPIPNTHPHSATLHPGDILFLPPLWLHAAAAPPPNDVSVAVNVFFRNLSKERYAAGRDVYGNRDLAAYERGRKDVERMVRSFEGVPGDMRRFYLERLAEELRESVGG